MNLVTMNRWDRTPRYSRGAMRGCSSKFAVNSVNSTQRLDVCKILVDKLDVCICESLELDLRDHILVEVLAETKYGPDKEIMPEHVPSRRRAWRASDSPMRAPNVRAREVHTCAYLTFKSLQFYQSSSFYDLLYASY